MPKAELLAGIDSPGRSGAKRPGIPLAGQRGFLHFPAVDLSHPDLSAYGDGISAWARVLARTLTLSLSTR